MKKYIVPLLVLTSVSCQEITEKQEELKEVTSAVSELDSIADTFLSESDKEKLMKNVSMDSIAKYKDQIGQAIDFMKDNSGLIDSLKNKAVDLKDKEINYDDIQKVLGNKEGIGSMLDSLKAVLQK